MSTDTNSAQSGGIGFAGVLLIVFIVLKLTHVITWSWLWVLSPFWIPALLAAVVLGVLGIVVLASRRQSGRSGSGRKR